MIIVSAAVIDDVIGIILLAFLTAVAGGASGVESLLPTLIAMAIFLAAVFVIGKPVMEWVFKKAQKAHTHEMTYSAAILIALVTAVLSNSAGLHYAIGAFIAGVLLGDHIRDDRMLFDSLLDFAFGFFVTIFLRQSDSCSAGRRRSPAAIHNYPYYRCIRDKNNRRNGRIIPVPA